MATYNLGLAFEKIAKQHSARVAVKFCDGQNLRYSELDLLSNRLARFLSGLGFQTGDVLCLAGDKTPTTFAAMVAALKLGVPYVILDPESPAERVSRVFSRCKPKAAVLGSEFRQKLKDVLAESPFKVLPSENLLDEAKALSAEPLGTLGQVVGSTAAYIMFTSGSTGFPKGAVITHDNVLKLVDWSQASFDVGPEDVLTNVNPLYFDNSVFDFYSAIFTGAALLAVPKSLVGTPRELVQAIDNAGCTLWFSTPSMLVFLTRMKVLNASTFKTLRRFIFGGEGYPKPALKQLYDLYHSHARFFNVYGPTECTCICSLYEVTAEDLRDPTGLPPIGYLATNFTYSLLDDDKKPVSRGQAGELFLLGPNVGRGYFNDPEITRKAFIQNPQNPNFYEIGYLTGDLLRLDPEDGKLYFVGRKDNQIKHMGYRIELEEIEFALNALKYVNEAAVVHGTIRGISQIVAAISLKEPVADQTILHDLRKTLPSYMIPTRLLIQDQLPKNQNEKIDRKEIKRLMFQE